MSNKHEATYHGGEYTPTTDEIKHAWYRSETADNPFDQRDAIKAEFDRWLATVKAEAWDEGAMASESLSCENPPCGVCEHCGTPLGNPYRREP